jgi:hypothetical protein
MLTPFFVIIKLINFVNNLFLKNSKIIRIITTTLIILLVVIKIRFILTIKTINFNTIIYVIVTNEFIPYFIMMYFLIFNYEINFNNAI